MNRRLVFLLLPNNSCPESNAYFVVNSSQRVGYKMPRDGFDSQMEPIAFDAYTGYTA